MHKEISTRRTRAKRIEDMDLPTAHRKPTEYWVGIIIVVYTVLQ